MRKYYIKNGNIDDVKMILTLSNLYDNCGKIYYHVFLGLRKLFDYLAVSIQLNKSTDGL